MFGDVEFDSESFMFCNLFVWQIVVFKIVVGKLIVIFIECSYDNFVIWDRLYGYLVLRYFVEEMMVLVKEVLVVKNVFFVLLLLLQIYFFF